MSWKGTQPGIFLKIIYISVLYLLWDCSAIVQKGPVLKAKSVIHGKRTLPCQSCHERDLKQTKGCSMVCHRGIGGHPVGVIQIEKTDLPLTRNRRLTCITCHEPHGKSRHKSMLRMDFDTLCMNCHNKGEGH